MNKCYISLILALCFLNLCYAHNSTTESTMNMQITKSNIIDRADQDSDDINELKRQLELDKVRADINKTNQTTTSRKFIGQTTVTSVMISSDARYATMQFIDGGFLDVTIGSRIGNYIVKAIDLNGVELQDFKHSHHLLFIGRLYSKNLYKNKQVFMPTPLMNVPPIQ